MSDAFNELKRIIIRSGIPLSRLAQQANCHPQTIAFWLDGKTREANIDTLVKVAGVFGRRLELTRGEVRLVAPDTPASVAAKFAGVRHAIKMARLG